MRRLVVLLLVFGACTAEVIHNAAEAQECRADGGTIKSNPDDPENTALCETNWITKVFAIWDSVLTYVFIIAGGFAALLVLYYIRRDA